MSNVTQLLEAVTAGDRHAADVLLPLVYDELRGLAAVRMAAEPAGRTLQPTALVHEAYLRLVGGKPDQRWDGRGHFFGAAAEAMRRILIDQARQRKAEKRGAGRVRQPLDPDAVPAQGPDDELLALNEALDRLATIEPQVAELVKLRYFAGLTVPEAAGALGVAPRTADAWWAYARAWLLTALNEDTPARPR